MKENRVQTLHPDPDKSGPRSLAWKYEAVRKAILRAVPRNGDGLPFKELARRVKELPPLEDLGRLGSVSWHTTTLKLDPEARGEVKRIPGVRPQRLLRG